MADLADKLVPIINGIADFAEANPELTRTVILATSAFVAFRIAATAARFALLWTKGGLLLAAISGMSGLGQATLGASKGFSLLRGGATIGSLFGTIFSGGMFAGLISALGSVVGMIGGVLAGIGAAIAGVTAPIWGIIAAIVALIIGLALTVYNYWVPISRFIVGFASVIGEALSGIINAISGFISAATSFAGQKIFDLMALLGIDPEKVMATIADVWNIVADFTSNIIGWFKSLPEAIGNWFSDIFTMNEYSDSEAAGFEEMGRNIAQKILDGLKNLPSTILSLIASIPSRLLSLAGAYLRLAMDWGGKLLQGFLYVLPMAINIWKSLPSRILSIAGNIMSVGLSLGLKMISGYWQGVTTIAGMLAACHRLYFQLLVTLQLLVCNRGKRL